MDFIEGFSPAVSIDQKSTSRNPRSTVGTITEVYDYLPSALTPGSASPHLPECGEPIARQHPQQIVDQVPALQDGPGLQVLAPVVRERKGEFVDMFLQPAVAGLLPIRVDGTVHQLADPPKLKSREAHHRGGGRPAGCQGRGAATPDGLGGDSVRLAGGTVTLEFVDAPRMIRTGAHLQRAPCLPVRRSELRGTRTTVVLVQLAVRRLS